MYSSSFAFVLQEDFDVFLRSFFTFCLFFVRKILIFFGCFFSESFFVFLIIFIFHFLYREKNYKKYFICTKSHKNILLVFLYFKKLTLVYDLVYDFFKLYELCQLYELHI